MTKRMYFKKNMNHQFYADLCKEYNYTTLTEVSGHFKKTADWFRANVYSGNCTKNNMILFANSLDLTIDEFVEEYMEVG